MFKLALTFLFRTILINVDFGAFDFIWPNFGFVWKDEFFGRLIDIFLEHFY